MKKITALFALLMLVCMGAQAQTATLMEGFGEPLTLTQFKAMANQSQRFGFVASSNTAGATLPRCDHWCGFTSTHNTTTLSDDYLFYLEGSEGSYKVKRVSDNKYVNTSTGSTSFGEGGFAFELINRDPNDATKAVTGAQSITFKNPAEQNWYNANAVKLNNGPGAFTTYAVFGPIYKNVTVDCRLDDVSMDGYPQQFAYKAGTIDAPEYPGKKLVDGQSASVTVSEDDQTITFNYESSSFDYTLVVNGAPEGTTIKIKDETVSAGAVSFESEVTQNDVVVTFPEGATYSYNVTISGTTITVNCVQLWPVNLGEGNVITVGEKTSSVTAATAGSDNDHWYIVTQVRNGESVLFARGNNEKLRRGTTAQTAASFNNTIATTNAAYLVRFISTGENDLYKMQFGNGQFVDASLMPSAADITNAATYAFYNSNNGEGSYFGWNINSKAGQIVDNNGAGNDVAFWGSGAVSGTSGNNVWYVYETTIAAPAYTITYVVNDENNNELFRSPAIPAAAGDVITTLPAEYQRAPFYTYNTVNVTIDGENEAVFTATMKPESEWPVIYTEDATNPHYYNMNIRSKYLVYNSTATGEVTLQDTSEPFNPAASWAFVGTPYDGFRLINQDKGTDYNLIYTSVVPGANHGNNNIQFQTVADAGEKVWLVDTNNSGIVLRMKENQSIYFHHDNGNNFLRTCALGEYQYVHDDAGSTIILTTDMEALVQLYNLLKDAPIGEGVNQYSATGVNPEEILANAGTVIDNEESSQYHDTYQALLNLQSAMTLNMPQAGMYRIKGNTSGKYLAAGLASNNKFAMTDAMDATTIFYYDGTKLVNYSDGKVNGMSTSAWAWVYENGDVSTVEIQDGESNGGYRIKSSDAYFFDGGTSADRGNGTDSRAQYHNWYFEEVTELPITLRSTDGTNYFATFSAPVNVQISDASLNTVTNNNKTAAYNTVDTDMLKAGVGVLLSGTSATATATIITDEVADANYGLVSYYAATAGTGDESMLYLGKGKTSGKAGFYKLGEGTTSNGFKAYLSTAAGAKEGLELEFAGVTGIDNMENGTLNMENGAVYNLQGQRVNKAQKGVFIQNGKKVVLK